jgi:hypothetical protein
MTTPRMKKLKNMLANSTANVVKTKMTKHTPGPWEVQSRPDGMGGKDMIVYADKRPVCDCFQPYNNSNLEEWQANARLIASAPEMLDLIKENVMHVKYPKRIKEWEEKARQLIAKTEGK